MDKLKMKTLILYIGKKYIISALNDVLEKYKDDVGVICEIISTWIRRLQCIIEELKMILARVSDGKIEDEEVLKSKEEIEAIIREWK